MEEGERSVARITVLGIPICSPILQSNPQKSNCLQSQCCLLITQSYADPFNRYDGCWHDNHKLHSEFCRFHVTRIIMTSLIVEGISVPGSIGMVTHSFVFRNNSKSDDDNKWASFCP